MRYTPGIAFLCKPGIPMINLCQSFMQFFKAWLESAQMISVRIYCPRCYVGFFHGFCMQMIAQPCCFILIHLGIFSTVLQLLGSLQAEKASGYYPQQSLKQLWDASLNPSSPSTLWGEGLLTHPGIEAIEHEKPWSHGGNAMDVKGNCGVTIWFILTSSQPWDSFPNPNHHLISTVSVNPEI